MSLESAALKSLDQIAALSAENAALRSQLAEREAEIKRLREAGDALADEATDLIGVVGEAGGCAPPLYEPLDAALATWHTATGRPMTWHEWIFQRTVGLSGATPAESVMVAAVRARLPQARPNCPNEAVALAASALELPARRVSNAWRDALRAGHTATGGTTDDRAL